LSPNFSQEGQLKRTVSQLSAGSEFQDDVLPLKIKKAHRKLLWESVKLYQEVTRTVTTQNGSAKKLPLRVKIQGLGFTVTPREDLIMIPLYAYGGHTSLRMDGVQKGPISPVFITMGH
jgi:hypothetical protein